MAARWLSFALLPFRLNICLLRGNADQQYISTEQACGWPTGFQRLKESVKGVPNSEEQMVAEKMRALLRFGAGSMHEEGRTDVCARLEKVFSDRRCVRQFSRAKDNWLELPVGEVTAGILSEVK